MDYQDLIDRIEVSVDGKYVHESGMTFALDKSKNLDAEYEGKTCYLMHGQPFNTRKFVTSGLSLEKAYEMASILDIVTGDDFVTMKKVVEPKEDTIHMQAMKMLIMAKEKAEGKVEAYENLLMGRDLTVGK